MVEKEVVWSLRAIHDKLEILDYWIFRNKSRKYSEKLDLLFDNTLKRICKNPSSGKSTDYQDIRIKIVRNYLIFYRIQKNTIEVIRIWDSRRDKIPEF